MFLVNVHIVFIDSDCASRLGVKESNLNAIAKAYVYINSWLKKN